MNDTSADLVLQAQAGRPEAFERLVEQQWPRMVRLARSIVGDPEAEDMVQDALVAAWRALPGLHEPERFGAWLARIVVRRRLACARRRSFLARLTRAETNLAFAVDREELVPTGGLPVDIRVTLLGFDDKLATYRVLVREAGRILANPTVSVPRDGRGIVGGRNGAAAPYFFLVIEPQVKAVEFSAGIPLPTLVKRVEPIYPEEARKNGVTGVVTLETFVDENGAVVDAKVVKSADPALDKAALQAVRQWRYQPWKDSAGKPSRVKMAVTVSFTLE